MQTSSLQEQKKELQRLENADLMELCLRLVRHKKENKELLDYLLFHSHDPMAYVEQVKNSLQADFDNLNPSAYYTGKSLRKILRVIGRHAKFIARPEAEMELLIWFCRNYLEKTDPKRSNKALNNILIRQLDKIDKLKSKLHEDLQFDYQQEIDKLNLIRF